MADNNFDGIDDGVVDLSGISGVEFQPPIPSSAPGVAFNPPPDRDLPSILASIDKALDGIPEGKRGALVTVATTAGVNAAVVARLGGGWAVHSWVGKTWGGPVEAGAAVSVSW